MKKTKVSPQKPFTAAERIYEWVYKNKPEEPLNLSNLHLTSLPEIPEGVQRLICSNNKLTSLPENLPHSIRNLYCVENKLTRLPKNLPPRLEKLSCSYNKLKTLPHNLPNTLTEIYCDGNEIEYLPESLPPNLTMLYCQMNRFKSLPESIKRTTHFFYSSENNDFPKIDTKKLALEGYEGMHTYMTENTYDYYKRILEYVERQRRPIVNERTRAIKEELMEKAWHPDRVRKWIEAGLEDF